MISEGACASLWVDLPANGWMLPPCQKHRLPTRKVYNRIFSGTQKGPRLNQPSFNDLVCGDVLKVGKQLWELPIALRSFILIEI